MFGTPGVMTMMHAGQHVVETLSVEATGDDVPKRGQWAGEGRAGKGE
jgi:hypothetical protein